MLGFNISAFYQKTFNIIGNTGNRISAQYGTYPRFPGQPSLNITPASIISAKNLPSLPLAPGLSIHSLSFNPPAISTFDSIVIRLTPSYITSNIFTNSTSIIQQALIKPLEDLSHQIVQSVTSCINQLLQTLIFKNPIIGVFAALSKLRSSDFDKIANSIKQDIKNEINNILHMKITIGETAIIRQKIFSRVNAVCSSASSFDIKNYGQNPFSIGIAANKAAINITSSLNSQILNPVPSTSAEWGSFI